MGGNSCVQGRRAAAPREREQVILLGSQGRGRSHTAGPHLGKEGVRPLALGASLPGNLKANQHPEDVDSIVMGVKRPQGRGPELSSSLRSLRGGQ